MKKDNYTLKTTLKTLTLIIALISSNLLIAQNLKYEWAHALGGADFEVGHGIHVDQSGNTYVTGMFQSTVDFDPGPGIVNVTSTNYDLFILKLDPAGDFLWVKTVGAGAGRAIFPKTITTDAAGNVYAIGRFDGSADFDPGTGTTVLTDNGSPGYGDAYILKLDASGDFLWAKSFGAEEDDAATAISVDQSGQVYVAGYFGSSVDFDPGPGTSVQSSNNTRCAYISKFQSSGDYVYTKIFDGPNASSEINGIDIDADGNIYSTGLFYETVDFDPGTGTNNLTPQGSVDAFVSKLDSSGNYIWVKTFAGKEAVIGKSISIDVSGNIYTSGTFKDTTDFDPGAGMTELISNGNYDIFISKLDSDGNYIWAKTFGGRYSDQIYGMAVGNDGSLYTTGQFSDTVDFDPGSGSKILATYYASIFISKLNSDGDFVWAEAYGGEESVRGNDIAIDGSGNVYATGFIQDTIDFIPSSDKGSISSNGKYDAFILKLSCEVDVSTTNDSVFVFAANANNAQYQWVDCDKGYAPITGETNQRFAATLPGNYAVIVTSGCSDTSVCMNAPSVGISDKTRVVNQYPLYPNPTTSQVTISNFKSTINQVTISDITGKMLHSFTPTSAVIDLSILPKGIYFITLKDGESTSTQRVIKN